MSLRRRLLLVLSVFVSCSSWVMAGGTPDGLDYQPSRVPTVGDPVSAGTGEEQLDFPLYSIPGPIPLDLTLRYLSQTKGHSDLLGGFYLNVPIIWKAGSNSLSVVGMHQMDEIEFTYTNGVWKNNAMAAWPYQLTSSRTNYFVLSPRDNHIYYFESISGQIALCRKKMNRAGNALYYNYTVFTNRFIPALASISNEFGMGIDVNMHNLTNNTWVVTSVVSRAEGAKPWVFRYGESGSTVSVLEEIQNPLGDRIHFTYQTNATCMTAMQLPRGNIPYKTGYVYTNYVSWMKQNIVTAQTNALGGVTRLTFDFAAGQMQELRPDGYTNIYQTTSYTTEFSRVAGAPDFLSFAGGMSLQFGQDAQGNITNTKTATGASLSQRYDAESGQMNSLVVGTNTLMDISFTTVTQSFAGLNGEVVDFTFRNETEQQYPDGSVQTMQYDASGNVTELVNGVSARWSFAYSSNGLLTNSVNPLGASERMAYTAQGLVARRVDLISGTNQYEYDAEGRMIREEDTLGHVTRLSYDALGRMTALTNALGNYIRYRYDANGNQTRLVHADGSFIDSYYNDMDQLIATTNALGQAAFSTYDSMLRLTTFVDASGVTNFYAYDEDGHLTNFVRGAYVWSGTYDADGLLRTEQGSGEPAKSYWYDTVGHVTRMVDGVGRTNTYAYDYMGNLLRATDSAGRMVEYAYDAAGQRISAALPGLPAATYAYDALGGLTSIVSPGGGQWRFGFSPAGLVTNKVDPLGRRTTYAYTPRGALASTRYEDGSSVAFGYDPIGQLTNVLAGSESISYSYDKVGRMIGTDGLGIAYDLAGRATQYVSGSTTYGVEWNLKNQLTQLTITPPGVSFAYTYDENGRVAEVTDSLSRGRASFMYNAAGQVTNVLRGNSVQLGLVWSEQSRGKLASIVDGSLINAAYQFDTLGRITAMTGSFPVNVGSCLLSDSNSWSFNAMNQLTNSDYSYSERGERLTSPGMTCRWDRLSRLQTMNQISNRYDAAGRLLQHIDTESGATNHYSYCDAVSQQTPLRIDSAAGNSIQAVVPGWGLVYTLSFTPSATNVLYYHYDQRGSTVATTDENGTRTGRYGYTPYGRLINPDQTVPPPFQFLGRFGCYAVNDAPALYRHGVRCYDPSVGRFISAEADWPDLGNPARLNIYNYAASDPVNLVDYNGLSFAKELDRQVALLDGFDMFDPELFKDRNGPFSVSLEIPGATPEWGLEGQVSVFMINGVPSVAADGFWAMANGATCGMGASRSNLGYLPAPAWVGQQFFDQYEKWRTKRANRNRTRKDLEIAEQNDFYLTDRVSSGGFGAEPQQDGEQDPFTADPDKEEWKRQRIAKQQMVKGLVMIIQAMGGKKEVVKAQVVRPALKKGASVSGR